MNGNNLKLKENSKIDLSKLADNEQFIDTVLVATALALKTSEKEKIKAFKNVILNTALIIPQEKQSASWMQKRRQYCCS